jgi:hypothetical protein
MFWPPKAIVTVTMDSPISVITIPVWIPITFDVRVATVRFWKIKKGITTGKAEINTKKKLKKARAILEVIARWLKSLIN